ncbi:MAG: class I SAM-dependent methyltransferase [Anaerolineae bacterium]
MDAETTNNLKTSYDRIAHDYVEHIYGELTHKPLDRALLNRFADNVRGRGTVCDMGCGPGHVARYLHERGVDVVGVDLSPGMVAEARRLNPDIAFREGSMLALDEADAAWAGMTAFYCIIHIPPGEVTKALREMRRVLEPGAPLFLAFHVGDEVLRPDEMWGQPVAIDFIFYRPEAMVSYLTEAGFAVEEVIERPPYPDVEHQSHRAYIFARKPA